MSVRWLFEAKPRMFVFEAGGTEGVNSFEKQPVETFPIGVNFGTNSRPEGVTVSSGTVRAQDNVDGNLVSGTILVSTVATVSGNKVLATVKSGTNKKTYKITFTVTLSDNSVLEEEVLMVVREK